MSRSLASTWRIATKRPAHKSRLVQAVPDKSLVNVPRELQTERLFLRRWQPTDLAPFAALNADPSVNEFLPAPSTRGQSDELAARIDANFDQHGFGFWAVEVRGAAPFIG